MSLLGEFFVPRRGQRSTEYGPASFRDPSLWGLVGRGHKTASGASVDEARANTIAAYWCGKLNLCNSFMSLPCHLYQRQPSGRRRIIYDHPGAKLVTDRPNMTWTMPQFKHYSLDVKIDWGQSIAEIERKNNGQPLALWPIHTSRVVRVWNDGAMKYRVANNNGSWVDLDPEDVVYVPLKPSWDGTWSPSVPGVARESLGLTVTADEYGARFFGNSATPGTVIVTQENLNDDEVKAFRSQWSETFGGDNVGGVAVLSNSGGPSDIKTISIPAKDAQFLETRKHQIEEIARWLNIPVHKLKVMDNAHFNNIEHSQIDYVTDSVMPHAIMMEEELTRKLLTQRERDAGLYFAFTMEGMLRGDLKTRMEAYSVGINNGSLTRDEARALEDRDPLPDALGAIPTVQAGVTSLAVVMNPPEPQPAPGEPPADNPPEPTPPDTTRAATLNAAFRSMLELTLDRLARIERDKVTRALKKPNDYPVWRESFLLEHGARAHEELAPLVTAHRTATGVDDDSADVVKSYMDRLAVCVRAANPEAIGKDNQWIFDRLLPEEK